jgi:predicted enzyme related to lactoylglutathione lyase
MARVVHFDIVVPNPDRAIRFYEQAFGWKAQKWDGLMEEDPSAK